MMWARAVEVMLACWLALSSFIFDYPISLNDLLCAILITIFSTLSCMKRLRHVHLLTFVIAFWLWGIGYLGFPSHPTIEQENEVIIGLLLLMLAIIPSRSESPSHSWEEFIRKRSKR